jgi:acyl-CoA synthetase (AMP-forming)/AMP-acid ligase II
VFIMGRVDDVINVAGHRLSTGAMEEVVAQHRDVAECAVIGAADSFKGQLPVGLVVLKAGVDRDPEELKERIGADGPGPDRTGGIVQGCGYRSPSAQDPFRQDPSGDHAKNR